MQGLLQDMSNDKKLKKIKEEIEEPFENAERFQNLPYHATPFNIELPGLEFMNI